MYLLWGKNTVLLECGFHLNIRRAPSSGLPVFICAKCEWELEKEKERIAAFQKVNLKADAVFCKDDCDCPELF